MSLYREFDTVSFIMDYEDGELNDQQIIDGFQELIDKGIVWKLQGSYGRFAVQLINSEYCVDTHNVLGK